MDLRDLREAIANLDEASLPDLITLLPPDRLETALRLARRIADPRAAAVSLAALAGRMDDAGLRAEAIDRARAAGERAPEVLAAIAGLLPDDGRRAVVDEALHRARGARAAWVRGSVAVDIAAVAPPDRLPDAWDLAARSREAWAVEPVLRTLASRRNELPAGLRDRLLAWARARRDPRRRLLSLAALFPLLTAAGRDRVLAEGLALVLASDDGAPEVVHAMAGEWAAGQRHAVVARALEAGGDVEEALRDALLEHLDAADATEAMRAAATLRDMDRRRAWLVALAPRLPEHVQVDAVEHLAGIRGRAARREALAAILPQLSASAQRQVLGAAARRGNADDWAPALASWSGSDAAAILPVALRVARLAAAPAERLAALANLSRFARPQERRGLVAGILEEAAALPPGSRIDVLGVIAPQLGVAQRLRALDQLTDMPDSDELRLLVSSLAESLSARDVAAALRRPAARDDPDAWTWALRQRDTFTERGAVAARDLARRMRDPAGRAGTLAGIAGFLPAALQAGAAADAMDTVGGAGDVDDLAGIIERVAPYLPDEARDRAAGLALGMDDAFDRGRAASALLPYATGRSGKRLERAVARLHVGGRAGGGEEAAAGGGGAPEGLADALRAVAPAARARLLDAGLVALARPREVYGGPAYGAAAEMGAAEPPETGELPEMAEMAEMGGFDTAETGGAEGGAPDLADPGMPARIAEPGRTATRRLHETPPIPAGRRAPPPGIGADFPGADGEGLRLGDETGTAGAGGGAAGPPGGPAGADGAHAPVEDVEPVLGPPPTMLPGSGRAVGDHAPHRARARHVTASRRAVSTGFADPVDPATPLPTDLPLPAGTRLLYWLEVGEPVTGAIDEVVTDLPAVLAAKPLEIEVVLFSPDSAFRIEGGPGLLVLAASGRVVRIRQPGGEVLDGRESPRLLLPLVTPERAGRYVLRCNLYVRRALVQSRLITATVSLRRAPPTADGAATLRGAASPARPRPIAVRSVVDYSITNELEPAALAGLSEHSLSLMLNDGPDGRSSFYYAASAGGATVTGSAAFDGQLIQSLVEETRAGLRWASWNDGGEWHGQPARYDGTRDVGRLRDDLVGMARRGYDVWDVIVPQLSGGDPDAFADATRRPGLVQISHKTSPRLLFPAALLYDHPLDTGLGSDRMKLCPSFVAALDAPGELQDAACFTGDCPSYGADDVVCPGGFWGYRHALGFPVAGVTLVDGTPGTPGTPGTHGAGGPAGDGPAWSNLPTEIEVPGVVAFLAAISTDPAFQPWAPHEQRLRALAPGMTWLLASDRDAAIGRMRDSGSHVVYFYCHGGTDQHEPFLRVGPPDGPMIMASTLSLRTRRVHWTAPRPLVFLNGCQTTSLEPEAAHPLVEAFVGRAEAAGVVGTEVTIFEGLARPFAEECLRRFLGGTPLGAAVRGARLALLKQGTPLGLVYIPYALPDLHVRKAD